jgi:hypothetical protein
MKMHFLPDGDDKPETGKPYWKMSQMKRGDNRFRIVKKPISGWIDWKNMKPLRYRMDEKPAMPVDPKKPIKKFWDVYVWDYEREGLFILEITQIGIINTLKSLGYNEDWGDYTKYDINLKKEGVGEATKYTVTPVPHKPLPEKALKALAASPVRLEALYDSGDPWTDLEGVDEETGEIASLFALSEAQRNQLADLTLGDEAIEKKICKHLQITDMSQIKPSDFDRVVSYIEKYREKIGA